MVERILSMLTQFLISNQSLQINESFKIYIKILSINHMQSREKRQHLKRTKTFYQNRKKKHYGGKSDQMKKRKYNFYWALDIPESFLAEPSQNVFKNKCLLVCTVLGLLQHDFFEKKKKLFSQIENGIKSTNINRQTKAGALILEQINNIIAQTNLPDVGPYEIETTCNVLSNVFKCQFIIFNTLKNNSKLLYMYPKTYDDALKPIYMYQPNSEKNHLIFIRKLSTFYGANFRICFACRKIFNARTSRAPWHICPLKQSCFACRRFYSTKNTYLNDNLKNNFCDKNLTAENPFSCSICNVTLFSNN